jgi:hypothetical protein
MKTHPFPSPEDLAAICLVLLMLMSVIIMVMQ